VAGHQDHAANARTGWPWSRLMMCQRDDRPFWWTMRTYSAGWVITMSTVLLRAASCRASKPKTFRTKRLALDGLVEVLRQGPPLGLPRPDGERKDTDYRGWFTGQRRLAHHQPYKGIGPAASRFVSRQIGAGKELAVSTARQSARPAA